MLIKNAVGVASIVGLFNVILSPLISIITFSLMLKTVCAIIEPVSDSRIVGLCSGIAKGITYLSAIIIIMGLIFFIMTLLMIMSANAFINCSGLESITVSEENEYYCDIAGVLFTKDKKILIQN